MVGSLVYENGSSAATYCRGPNALLVKVTQVNLLVIEMMQPDSTGHRLLWADQGWLSRMSTGSVIAVSGGSCGDDVRSQSIFRDGIVEEGETEKFPAALVFLSLTKYDRRPTSQGWDCSAV